MKKIIILTILLLLGTNMIFAQEQNDRYNDEKGLRIKRTKNDSRIYADSNYNIIFADYRKLNHQVYFRTIDYPTKLINGKTYQLITIPGKSPDTNVDYYYINNAGKIVYSRTGKSVNKPDYDKNFWIDVDIIKNNTNIEYFQYANDISIGLLSAPFKYRLDVGEAPASLIDGNFNVAPFIGWKWRTSPTRPFYISPFIFGGVTTLVFNSANNANLLDANKIENGAGLTYGLGLSLKFYDFSPGFIIGWDKGFGNLGEGFLYNDKPWISFSVNYDFFKPKNNPIPVTNK